MRKFLTTIIFVSLVLTLASCSKKDDSSSSGASQSLSNSSSQSISSVSAPQTSSSSSSSASTSASKSSAESESTDTSKSESAETEITSEGWPTSFVSTKDINGTTVLVEVKAPVEWQFDGTSTFFLDGKKVMEIAGLEVIADKANPFEAAYKDQYTKNPEGIPEDFGFIDTEKIKLESCNAILHRWKMWPDDSDKPWYPHCYFVEKNDYLVAATFYALDENCSALHKTYDVVLNELSLFK